MVVDHNLADDFALQLRHDAQRAPRQQGFDLIARCRRLTGHSRLRWLALQFRRLTVVVQKRAHFRKPRTQPRRAHPLTAVRAGRCRRQVQFHRISLPQFIEILRLVPDVAGHRHQHQQAVSIPTKPGGRAKSLPGRQWRVHRYQHGNVKRLVPVRRGAIDSARVQARDLVNRSRRVDGHCGTQSNLDFGNTRSA